MFNRYKQYYLRLNPALFKNFLSLGFLQLSNLLLPLLIFPFLIRIIGVENFGLVAFAQALINYFLIFTDYGFNLSATREIALARGNKAQLQTIFSAVLTTKILLMLVSFLFLTAILWLIPYFEGKKALYLLSFVLVPGQVFLPIWFFQGVEDMKYIAYLNVLAKTLFAVLVYLLITHQGDYIYTNFFLGCGNFLAAFISLYIIKRKYGIRLQRTPFRLVKHQLNASKEFFISNFSVNVYVNSNLFILGLFASPQVIGYYSIVEKVIQAVRQLLSVFSQVIYPHLCKLTNDSFKSVKLFIRKVIAPFGVIVFAICITLFLFADIIIQLLIGENIPAASLLLRILSIVPFIVYLNIPAYQVLLINNFKNSYSAVLFLGSVLNIVLNLVLASKFQALGTAASVIITEIFITFALYWVLEAKHAKFSILKNRKLPNEC